MKVSVNIGDVTTLVAGNAELESSMQRALRHLVDEMSDALGRHVSLVYENGYDFISFGELYPEPEPAPEF